MIFDKMDLFNKMEKIVKELKYQARKCVILNCNGYANISTLEDGKLVYYCLMHYKQRVYMIKR